MKTLIMLSLAAALLLGGGTASAKPAKCIDVEKASAVQLQKLKGVGPAMAKKIINHRKAARAKATKAKKGTWNFRNWAALYKIAGVGPKLCKDNLALVCFSGKVQKACPKK